MSEYILDFLQFLRVKDPFFVKLCVKLIIAIVLSVFNGIFYVILNLHVLIPLVINYYVKILSPNNIPSPRTISKIPLTENVIQLYRIQSKHGIDRPSAFLALFKDVAQQQELQDLGVFKLWVGTYIVMITRPEAAEVILRKTNLPKAWFYKAFETENLGFSGLVTGNGDVWKIHRKLLTPAFDYRICESVVPIMNEHSIDMVIALKDLIVTDNGITDDISAFFKHCTFDILFETACGLSSKSNRPGYREANHAFIENLEIFAYRGTRPWLMFEPLFQMTAQGQRKAHLMEIMLKFLNQIYEERRTKIEDNMNNNTKKNFLDTLITEHINNPELMTFPDLQGEMLTFLTAGFETIATTLTWISLLLGHHPEVQDKIIQELDDVLGDTDVRSDDIRRLKYTEAAVKEAMRIYPTVTVMARDIKEEDIEVPLGQTGRTAVLPIGSTIAISPYLIHRCPDHWPDPEVFDPERFLNNERRHPYSFIPFSAGPRNCVGQKFAMLVLLCIIAYFFRNFRIKTLIPMSEVKASPRATYMTYGSNPVQIELREKSKVQHVHVSTKDERRKKTKTKTKKVRRQVYHCKV